MTVLTGHGMHEGNLNNMTHIPGLMSMNESVSNVNLNFSLKGPLFGNSTKVNGDNQDIVIADDSSK